MMSEILGYDIDGQPLRVGDRVVPADDGKSGWHAEIPEWPWTVRKVVFEGEILAEEPDRDGDSFCFYGEHVRKLPPKQADNETVTWESIEQLTGWVPEGVVA